MKVTLNNKNINLNKLLYSNANISNLYMFPSLSILGELMYPQESYVAWSNNSMQYDNTLDKIIMFINGKNGTHTSTSNVFKYLAFINPITGECESYKRVIASENTSDELRYFKSFCFAIIDDVWIIITSDGYRIVSTDHGQTFTNTGRVKYSDNTDVTDYTFWTLSVLNNNRFIVSNDSSEPYCMYSDDLGLTWTKVTLTGFVMEGFFLQLNGDECMCISRASMSGCDGDISTRNKIITPPKIAYSHDNGTTWTNFVNSKSIINMNATNCYGYVFDDGTFELLVPNRYPANDNTDGTYDVGTSAGYIDHYKGKVEQLINDTLDTPMRIATSNNILGVIGSAQDFGHMGGCVDNKGVIHACYYDLSVITEHSITPNYFYLKAGKRGKKETSINIDKTFTKQANYDINYNGLSNTNITDVYPSITSNGTITPSSSGLSIASDSYIRILVTKENFELNIDLVLTTTGCISSRFYTSLFEKEVWAGKYHTYSSTDGYVQYRGISDNTSNPIFHIKQDKILNGKHNFTLSYQNGIMTWIFDDLVVKKQLRSIKDLKDLGLTNSNMYFKIGCGSSNTAKIYNLKFKQWGNDITI